MRIDSAYSCTMLSKWFKPKYAYVAPVCLWLLLHLPVSAVSGDRNCETQAFLPVEVWHDPQPQNKNAQKLLPWACVVCWEWYGEEMHSHGTANVLMYCPCGSALKESCMGSNWLWCCLSFENVVLKTVFLSVGGGDVSALYTNYRCTFVFKNVYIKDRYMQPSSWNSWTFFKPIELLLYPNFIS